MGDYTASGPNCYLTATAGNVNATPILKAPLMKVNGDQVYSNAIDTSTLTAVGYYYYVGEFPLVSAGSLKITVEDQGSSDARSCVIFDVVSSNPSGVTDLTHVSFLPRSYAHSSEATSRALDFLCLMLKDGTPDSVLVLVKNKLGTSTNSVKLNICAEKAVDGSSSWTVGSVKQLSQTSTDPLKGYFDPNFNPRYTELKRYKTSKVGGLLYRESRTSSAKSSGTISTVAFTTAMDNDLDIDVSGSSDVFTCEEHCIWIISYEYTIQTTSAGALLEMWIEATNHSGRRFADDLRDSAPSGLHKFANTCQIKLAPGDEIRVKAYANVAYTLGSTSDSRYGKITITRKYY